MGDPLKRGLVSPAQSWTVGSMSESFVSHYCSIWLRVNMTDISQSRFPSVTITYTTLQHQSGKALPEGDLEH